MKKTLLLITLVSAFTMVSAQYHSWPEFFSYDLKLLNPALTGSSGSHLMTLMHNADVRPLDGASDHYLLSYDNLLASGVHGVGAASELNRVGVHTTFRQHLFYSHCFRFNEKSDLSFGASGRYELLESDFTKLPRRSGFYSGTIRQTKLDYGLGVSYRYAKAILGVSLQNNESPKAGREGHFNPAPGYFDYRWLNVYAEREFTLKKWLSVTPGILYASSGSSGKISFNARATIAQRFLIGYQSTSVNLRKPASGTFVGMKAWRNVTMVCRIHSKHPMLFNESTYLSFMLQASLKGPG